MVTSTKHIVHDDSFGGFFRTHIEFDMTCTISDDKSNMSVDIANFTFTNTPGIGNAPGFINVTGFLWGERSFSSQNVDYGSLHMPEAWDTVKQSISNVIGTPLDSAAAFYAYCDDKNGSIHGVVKCVMHKEFALTSSDFDKRGRLKDRIILTNFNRYTTDGKVRILSSSGTSWTMGVLDWPYYPGAYAPAFGGGYPVMGWFPCDKDNGHMYVLKGGEWKDVMNDVYEDSKSMLLYKHGNEYIRCPELTYEEMHATTTKMIGM